MTKEERLAEIEKTYSPGSIYDGCSNPQVLFSRQGFSNFLFLIQELKNSWKREEIAVRALKAAHYKFDKYSKEVFWTDIVEAKYPARKPMERCRDDLENALAEIEKIV